MSVVAVQEEVPFPLHRGTSPTRQPSRSFSALDADRLSTSGRRAAIVRAELRSMRLLRQLYPCHADQPGKTGAQERQ